MIRIIRPRFKKNKLVLFLIILSSIAAVVGLFIFTLNLALNRNPSSDNSATRVSNMDKSTSLSSTPDQERLANQIAHQTPGPKAVPGEVLARLKEDSAKELLNNKGALFKEFSVKYGLTKAEPVFSKESPSGKLGLASTLKLSFSENINSSKVIKQLNKDSRLVYAEPNYTAHFYSVPNDPLYSYQWNMKTIGMEEAWKYTAGEGVVVAIIDTGIAYENYGSYKQISDFSQTKFVQGYDFLNNDAHPNDDAGHGTKVAGTIAQSTNNNLGVAGIAYNSHIMPLKIGKDEFGFADYDHLSQAIIYAADHSAKVVNMSCGGPFPSETLESACEYAYSKGVTMVAAVGNNGIAYIPYPARYDEVIAVGATRYDETLTNYSNYGTGLDIVAPGGDKNVDQNNDGKVDGVLQQGLSSSFSAGQGTSYATPHVAGVAALLVSCGVDDPQEVREILFSTAKDKGSEGYDLIYGYGLLDAEAAVKSLDPPLKDPPPFPDPPPQPDNPDNGEDGQDEPSTDNPPSVRITSPSHQESVSGKVIVEASASDDSSCAGVKFYVNGSLKQFDQCSPYTYIWDTTQESRGEHQIRVIAIDSLSQTAEANIEVSVERPQLNFNRLWGNTCFGTSAAISQAGWPDGSETVLIARGDYFTDALAGASLSYRFQHTQGKPAPILLTDSHQLSPETEAEIRRLGAQTAIVLGGPGAVSRQVDSQISRQTQVTEVQRIYGETSYGTARDISKRMQIISAQAQVSLSTTAVITTGEDFSDALAVSSPASYNNMPILLVKPFASEPPPETQQALAGIERVVIVGGPGAVHPTLEDWLNSHGHSVVKRLWGTTGYDTAIDIATSGKDTFQLKNSSIIIARGDFFTDGLVGGVFASSLGPAPVILVEPCCVPASTRSYLTSARADAANIYILGGRGAISDGTKSEIESIFNDY